MKNMRIISIYILTVLCLLAAIMLPSCSSTPTTPAAKNGDTVWIDYTLTLADGTLVQTSIGHQPLELVIGAGKFLPGFEKAIVGMKVGESKTITILAANAYPYRDDMVFTVNRTQIQDGADLKLGDHLQGRNTDGQIFDAVVIAVSDTSVTLDGNGPLTDKDLTFKINLLEID
jgi:peptidylprolyl isomerase